MKLNLLGKIMSDNTEVEAANLVNRIFYGRNFRVEADEENLIGESEPEDLTFTPLVVPAKAVYLGRKELMVLLRSSCQQRYLVNESTFLCRKFKIFGLPIVEVNEQSYFRVV